MVRSCCSKIIASYSIKVRHWKDMNVNVTVELEIILCQHHVTTGCFNLVHIFASTKYLLSHLLIARCDIGVQLFVRSSFRPSTIYVKVLTL